MEHEHLFLNTETAVPRVYEYLRSHEAAWNWSQQLSNLITYYTISSDTSYAPQIRTTVKKLCGRKRCSAITASIIGTLFLVTQYSLRGSAELFVSSAAGLTDVATSSNVSTWESKARFSSMITHMTQFDQRPKQACHLVECEDTRAIVENMSDGEVIAILRPRLSLFLESVREQNKHEVAVVLVLFNYDDTFTDVDANAVFSVLPRTTSIYANNALSANNLVHAIPLGLPYHRLCAKPASTCEASKGKQSKIEGLEARLSFCREASRSRRVPALFVPYMSATHESRSELRDALLRIASNGSIVFGQKRDELVNYICDFARYRFVLSLRGAGLDAFRTCEILAAGSCPVFIQEQSTKVTKMYTSSTCAVMFKDINEFQRAHPRLITQGDSELETRGSEPEFGLCRRDSLVSHIRSFNYSGASRLPTVYP